MEEVAESWVTWIQRTTHEVIDIMGKVGMSDWVEEQSRRKWQWCGHTMRRQDGRWSLKLLLWMPENGYRNRGHPSTRWSDSIVAFMADALQEEVDINDFIQIARCRELWAKLEELYKDFCQDGVYTEIDPRMRNELHELRVFV